MLRFAFARRSPSLSGTLHAGALLLALLAANAQATTTLLVSVNTDAAPNPGSCGVSFGFGSCNTLRDAIAYAQANPDTTTHQTLIYFKSFLDGTTIELTNFSDDPGCVTTDATACQSGTPGGEFGASAFFIKSTGQSIVIDASTDDNGVPFTHGLTIARDTIAADYPGPPATAPDFRLFDIGVGGNLTLRGLTLTGGVAHGGSSNMGGGALGAGGAIFNQGTLAIERCTINGNLALGGNTGVTGLGLGGGGVGADATDGYGQGGGPNGGAVGYSGGFGGGGSLFELGGFGGGGGGGATAGGGGFGGGGGGVGGGSSASGANGGFGGGSGNGGNGVNGVGGGGAGFGSAIFNDAGNVSLTNTTLYANTASGGSGARSGAALGGGVFNYNGALTIDFSTLSGNTNAIYSLGDGNCNNTGIAPSGGNICSGSTATLTINNSIVANSSGSGDITTNTINGGSETHTYSNNLTGTVPLGAFTGAGGFLGVLVPPPGSPAIDQVSCGTTTIDERGVQRPKNVLCDLGAVEVVETLTTTSVAAAPGTSTVFGQPVTFTATVTGSSPTGSVSFLDGTTALCNNVSLVGGQASCTPSTTALSAGTHTIDANYSGDSAHSTSTASLIQTVGQAGTTTTVAATVPIEAGVGEKISVTIAAQAPGSGTATGSVVISDGTGDQCIATLSAGVGSCVLIPASAGTKTLSAVYAGDANFTGSTGGASLTVNPATSATLIVTTNADSALGTDDCSVISPGLDTCVTLRGAIDHMLAAVDASNTILFDASLDGATIKLTTFSNDPGCVTSAATTCQSGTLGTEFGASAFFLNQPRSFMIDATADNSGKPFAHGVAIARDPTQPSFRLFDIGIGASVTLRGLALTGGVAQGGSSYYGGGALGAGGAIFNQGKLTVERCTFNGNSALGGAGGTGSASGGAGVGAAASGAGGGAPNGGGSAGGLGGGGGGDVSGVGGAGGFGGGGGRGFNGGGTGGFGGGGGGNSGFSGGGGTGGFGGGVGGSSFSPTGGGGAGMGGAIFNDAGTVHIVNTTLYANVAKGGAGSASGFGGGIFNYNGTLTIDLTTLSNNSATMSAGPGGASGDAVYSLGDGNCNALGTAPSGGNVCSGTSATLTMTNSIAANSAGGFIDVMTSAIKGGGETHTYSNNLTGTVTLGAFTNAAGFLGVLVPPVGSAAIDVGSCGSATIDQRGTLRKQGIQCDVGAVEVMQALLTVQAGSHGSVASANTDLIGAGISACSNATCTAYYDIESAPTITLTATPDADSYLVGWSGDCSGAAASTTVTMDRARTCTATFALNGACGSANGQTLIAPPSGSAECSAGSASIVSGNGHPWTWTCSNTGATASCSANIKVLSVTTTGSSAGGAISSPLSSTVDYGNSTTFTVIANIGYSVAVTGDTCTPSVQSGSTYTTGPVTANCIVTAAFSQETFAVTTNAGANGALTLTDAGINLAAVPYGTALHFAVAPGTGYSANVSGCGGTLSGNTFATAAITQACTITASFVATAPVLNLTLVGGDAYVRYGEVLPYTATLTNNGVAEATNVGIDFGLSAGLDAINASWSCVATGATCPTSSSASMVISSLPVGGTLTWTLHVPVLAATADPAVDVQVSVNGAVRAANTATLVIYRNGFD